MMSRTRMKTCCLRIRFFFFFLFSFCFCFVFFPPPTLQNRGRFQFLLMGGCHAPILIGCEIKAYLIHQVLYIDNFLLWSTLTCQSQEDIFLSSFIFFIIFLPLYFLSISSMLTSASSTISVYFTIAYTIDTILSSYHPLIPWLAMRQNNCTPIRLGDIVGLEHTHGPSFHAQPSPMYGRI